MKARPNRRIAPLFDQEHLGLDSGACGLPHNLLQSRLAERIGIHPDADISQMSQRLGACRTTELSFPAKEMHDAVFYLEASLLRETPSAGPLYATYLFSSTLSQNPVKLSDFTTQRCSRVKLK